MTTFPAAPPTSLSQDGKSDLGPHSGPTPQRAPTNPPVSLDQDGTSSIWDATLPLDIVPGAGVGYSYRKIRAAYAGKAAKITRDSDLTSQDIGFTPAGDFDAAAFNAFVPSNYGRNAKWYDQSNANDAVGNVGDNLPVVFSHVPQDHTRWGGFTTQGTHSYMSAPANANIQNPWATGGFFLAVVRIENQPNGTNGAAMAKGTAAGWEINNYCTSGGDNNVVVYFKAATTDGFWQTNEKFTLNELHLVTVSYDARTPNVAPHITLDGVACTLFTFQNPVGAIADDTGAPLILFNDNVLSSLGNGFGGGLYEVLLYKSIPSPADQATLIANVKAYYQIP